MKDKEFKIDHSQMVFWRCDISFVVSAKARADLILYLHNGQSVERKHIIMVVIGLRQCYKFEMKDILKITYAEFEALTFVIYVDISINMMVYVK